MKAVDKNIGRLIVGCVLACCLSQNINAQTLPNPGGGGDGGGGTNGYDPYDGFNPTPVITYPTNVTLKWYLAMPASGGSALLSLAPDGTLYVPSAAAAATLWAIDPSVVDPTNPNYPAPDSFTNWVFNFGHALYQTPTVDRNGIIYASMVADAFTSGLFALYAISPTNSVIWTFATSSVESQPTSTAIGNDGTVYNLGKSYICALTNAPGQSTGFTAYDPIDGYSATFGLTNVGLKWMNYEHHKGYWFQAANQETCIPVIGADGTLYCKSYTGTLYAFNATNGAILWSTTNPPLYNIDPFAPTAPAIGSDGTIFYGVSRNFQAVNPKAALGTNGTMPFKWVYYDTVTDIYGSAAEWFCGSPVIGSDGTVYVETESSSSNKLFAFNPTNGVPKWSTPIGTGIAYYGRYDKSGSLAVAADGEIYLADSDGTLYSFAPNGSINWTFQTGSYQCLNSPLIGPDGTIYVESLGGDFTTSYVYAFAGVSPIACSAWPEDGRNGRRTGAVALASAGSPIMTTNGFKFAISGLTNAPVCPCSSSDLVTWTNLGQTVLTGGKTNFVDIGSTNYPYRFYRAFSQ